VAILAKYFDIPTMTLTTVSKIKDKKILTCFLSEYTRKHDPVRGNPHNRTLLTLARL